MLKGFESVGFIQTVFEGSLFWSQRFHLKKKKKKKKIEITILLNITIWCSDLVAKKYFLLLSMLKTVVLFNIFVEKVMHFSLRILWWIESWKKMYLLNVSLLNTFIYLFKKKSYWPQAFKLFI